MVIVIRNDTIPLWDCGLLLKGGNNMVIVIRNDTIPLWDCGLLLKRLLFTDSTLTMVENPLQA